MAGLRVDDLTVWDDKYPDGPGGFDAAGHKIVCIYAKVSGEYAIYRSGMRMTIHYADDADLAARQRAAIVPLIPVRGEIGGLINGWQDNDTYSVKARAERYNRRIADALVVTLEQFERGAPIGLALLADIRGDIVAHRKSIARFQYLAVASAFAVAVLLGLWVLNADWYHDNSTSTSEIMNALGGGVVGSFFSVATGLRNRTVLTDLRWHDNISDALLRMLVGVISAILLITILNSDTIAIQVQALSNASSSAGGPPERWMPPFVIGVLAGFLERLVPDLLSRAGALGGNAAGAAGSGGTVAAGQAAAVTQAVSSASSAHSLRGDAGPQDGEASHDNCLCDAPAAAEEEVTTDEDLPVSVGGVSSDTAPPSAGLPAAEPPPEAPETPQAALPAQIAQTPGDSDAPGDREEQAGGETGDGDAGRDDAGGDDAPDGR